MSKYGKVNLFILFLTYLFACIRWQFINTVLISFGVEYIKVDTVAMASLGGSVAIISLLIRPVSGVITDRINTKLIYTASMFLLFVSYLGFAFCHDYFWLYFFQILRGFSWTFFNVAGQCTAADISENGKLGQTVSVYMLGASIANILSGYMSLSFVNTFGYRINFIFASCITLLGCIFSLFLKIKNYAKPDNKRKITFNNIITVNVIPIAAMAFIFQIFVMAFGGGFVTDFSRRELNIANAGIFMMITGTVGAVSKIFYGRLYDKKGFNFVITSCLVGIAAAAAVMCFVKGYFQLYTAAFIAGIFTSGPQAALQAEAVKRAEDGNIGAATSTRSIGNDLGYMAGSIFMAFFVDAFGSYRFSYIGIFVLCILSIVLYRFILQRRH